MHEKIIRTTTNNWHCPKCNVDIYECDCKYLLKIDLQDHIEELLSFVSFEDVASTIIGINAKDVHLLLLEPNTIKEIISNIQCKQTSLHIFYEARNISRHKLLEGYHHDIIKK